MSLNTILTIRMQDIGSQKQRKSADNARWKKVTSLVRSRDGNDLNWNFRLEYYILNLLDKTFSREFIKPQFFTNSENKKRNFTVIFTIHFHWEISVIHRKAYKKIDSWWLWVNFLVNDIFWQKIQVTVEIIWWKDFEPVLSYWFHVQKQS